MKNKSANALFLVSLSLFATAPWAYGAETASASPAKAILIQHNGRVKTLDAFARQTLEGLSEKESWNGRPALPLVLEALGRRESAGKIPWMKVSYRELVSGLGLPEERRFFSYDEILQSLDKLETLARKCQAKRDADLRPSMLEQKAESLYGRMVDLKKLMTGESIKVIPAPDERAWLSPYETKEPLGDEFKSLVQSFDGQEQEAFARKAAEWKEKVRRLTGGRHVRTAVLEVFYLNTRPFQISWIAYLSAFLIFTFLKPYKRWGIPFLSAALFSHTLGLILRVLILSRPPVSNMYESMVFMNWVLMITACLFSIFRKNLTLASVGSLMSGVIMIYGNLLPIDSNLEVLVPVLRSNYWLTIHVLTIVSSYGVLGLAMGLGHRHLILQLQGKLSKKEEERSADTLSRVIQIGTLLLGIGTVLGGVWANESWGRFWGWDPKETWALITFLGYSVVIHLKYSKVLKPFGLALCSVLGFFFVLMTWYGVNFVLGRGLHSYGQGSGGTEWVVYYLAAEAVFVVFVILRRRSG